MTLPLADNLDFIRRGLGVRRYHQIHTFATDTVGKHSAGVATFLVLMQPHKKLPSAALLVAALAHDLPECVVGDIPSPAKRAMSSTAQLALSRIEDGLLEDHGLDPGLTDEEWRQLKLADCFDGLMFCIEERRRGNTEIIPVAERYMQYISDLPRSENLREQAIRTTLESWWSKANDNR